MCRVSKRYTPTRPTTVFDQVSLRSVVRRTCLHYVKLYKHFTYIYVASVRYPMCSSGRTSVHARPRVHVYVCVCLSDCLCVRARLRVRVSVRAYAHVCACVCSCMGVFACGRVCRHMCVCLCVPLLGNTLSMHAGDVTNVFRVITWYNCIIISRIVQQSCYTSNTTYVLV